MGLMVATLLEMHLVSAYCMGHPNTHYNDVNSVNAHSVDSANGNYGPDSLFGKRDPYNRISPSYPNREDLSLSIYEGFLVLYNTQVQVTTLKE